MKFRNTLRFLLVAALFNTTLLAGESKSTPCVVTFLNGDIMHGAFRRIEPKEGVEFLSEHFHKDVTFKLNHLKSITTLTNSNYPLMRLVAVELSNGDSLSGESITTDGGKAFLASRAAGVIPIPLRIIKTIKFVHSRTMLQCGFDNLEKWKFIRRDSSSGFLSKKGVLNLKGTVYFSSNFEIPDSARIDFDVSLNASLYVFLHHKPGVRYPKRCVAAQLDMEDYEIRFFEIIKNEERRIGKNLRNASKFFSNPWLKEDDFEDEDEIPPARMPIHVTITTDRKKGSLNLYLNYHPALKSEHVEFPKGNGISFLSTNSDNVRLRNLKICEWAPNEPVVPPHIMTITRSSLPKHALLLTTDKDRYSGNLKAIDKKNVIYTTKYAELKLPLGDVALIRLPRTTQTTAISNSTSGKGIVRAVFIGGDSLTTFYKSIDTKQMLCSGIFDGVSIPSRLFRRFEFNGGKKERVEKNKESSLFSASTATNIETGDDSNEDDENEEDFFDNL